MFPNQIKPDELCFLFCCCFFVLNCDFIYVSPSSVELKSFGRGFIYICLSLWNETGNEFITFLAGVTAKNYTPAESAPEPSVTTNQRGVAKSLVFDSLDKMTENKVYIINMAAVSLFFLSNYCKLRHSTEEIVNPSSFIHGVFPT